MLNILNMVYLYLTCNILAPFLAVPPAYLAVHPAYLAIHPEMFVSNLQYMGLGMLCIIIVMAVIIGVVLVLNKATAALARKKAEQDSSENE